MAPGSALKAQGQMAAKQNGQGDTQVALSLVPVPRKAAGSLQPPSLGSAAAARAAV